MLMARLQPRNCGMTDVVGAANLDQRLPRLSACDCLRNLVTGELWLAAKLDPSRHCPFAPFSRAGKDHAPLEFRQCSEHSQDQLAVWRCGIDHWIGQ